MNSPLEVPLSITPEQAKQLTALQMGFAAACNAIAPVAQAHHCWNRVALHHLTYRDIRQQFPQLGSQMACNAIYSVSRTYRLILNHPQSPWNIEKHAHAALPLLRFQNDAPVYFDRHTLSLRNGQVSMFTLDGRMRFQLDLAKEAQEDFVNNRLREIILRRVDERLVLQFWFGEETIERKGRVADTPPLRGNASEQNKGFPSAVMPEYVRALSAEEANAGL